MVLSSGHAQHLSNRLKTITITTKYKQPFNCGASRRHFSSFASNFEAVSTGLVSSREPSWVIACVQTANLNEAKVHILQNLLSTEPVRIKVLVNTKQYKWKENAVGQCTTPNSNHRVFASSKLHNKVKLLHTKLYWNQDCEESEERARNMSKLIAVY